MESGRWVCPLAWPPSRRSHSPPSPLGHHPAAKLAKQQQQQEQQEHRRWRTWPAALPPRRAATAVQAVQVGMAACWRGLWPSSSAQGPAGGTTTAWGAAAAAAAVVIAAAVAAAEARQRGGQGPGQWSCTMRRLVEGAGAAACCPSCGPCWGAGTVGQRGDWQAGTCAASSCRRSCRGRARASLCAYPASGACPAGEGAAALHSNSSGGRGGSSSSSNVQVHSRRRRCA